MNTLDRGSKHVCPECATKYYDLKKSPVLCPKCGTKPVMAKAPKASQGAAQTRKTGRSTNWRNP